MIGNPGGRLKGLLPGMHGSIGGGIDIGIEVQKQRDKEIVFELFRTGNADGRSLAGETTAIAALNADNNF